MFNFGQDDMNEFVQTHVIPWGISLVTALLIFIIGKIVVKILVGVIGKLLRRTNLDNILVEFIQAIANALLLIVVIIAALDQLGVDTTSLIALIGAAGLAIGLALQGSLQNFAAGFLLLVFRPFTAGDYIEAGGTAGVVKTIGIFTTTLNSPDNKEIVVPNGAIYSGNITNYSALPTRRVDLVFGIGYGDDIKKAKEIMDSVVKADERVLADPAPQIAVSELADSSVNFVVRPWVNSADYWGVKFDLTENIKLAFDENGISIPFPQMDVHLQKEEDAA
ncbi:mechanosensitive ion channel [Gilvimarinus agarilyticus]|uniref:mechanosensitive ion channel family protein n=1 Tax=unclassified Gilvimarinus TaxID=2642066 RepID=UPI001C085DA5|nr:MULTISPECIES: mechanosensitive ion channel domain-containing protein [unclassified Gilvimarinus]MBU2886887.1 mechanosensitive ion channel [Gilvimarinus agarilyticus]MDO6571548.1 mechanosensitive ion channel [Gilvimarinus sp. 2_MG-2023]MDO6747929.1 mechanosensitive ion channel [Gilvimarinus sp. 1_MG-2023]